MSNSIAVTGATGFVGRALLREMYHRGLSVRGLVREYRSSLDEHVSDICFIGVGSIDENTNWSEALKGVSCVIHCAAKTQTRDEYNAGALNAYRAVNVEGTRRLAEQSAAAGVKRMVYLSSAKVNGEGTDEKTGPFSGGLVSELLALDNLSELRSAYSISKMEAEKTLWEISVKTGLELVIVRPPLVYGRDVKGNFAHLLSLVSKGWPMPFACVNNRRSLIGIENLIDFLICCIDHREAPDKIFLVSDGYDLSTPELLEHIALAMNRRLWLIPAPISLLRIAANALGKGDQLDRLIGSFQVNVSHAKKILNWEPPLSFDDCVRRTIHY